MHLSAGELLREEMATGSEEAKLIDVYIKEGQIVPVRITCALLKKAMRKWGWEKREYLIDGYPRNTENYEGWVHETQDSVIVKQVICLECPKEVMLERMMKRAANSGRTDDNLTSFNKRFDVFMNETSVVLGIFEKKGLLRRVYKLNSH